MTEKCRCHPRRKPYGVIQRIGGYFPYPLCKASFVDAMKFLMRKP